MPSWRPLLLALALALPASEHARAEAQPPLNVVLIVADDLGASELGCYGNFEHETPSLDRLAEEGMRFRTCWSTPLDTPSRVLLLTGRYAWRTGYFDDLGRKYTPRADSDLYDVSRQKTFAHLLDESGYATCMVGTWGLPGRLPGLIRDYGFDEYRCWAGKRDLPDGVKHTGGWETKPDRGTTSRTWNPCILENGAYVPTAVSDYGPDLFADYAIEFIERHRGESFLVYYPMVLAHKPWAPTPDPALPGGRTKGGFAANLVHLDRIVGRITAAVDRMGLGERTLILFTSDCGARGTGKQGPTEQSVRVPLIARCPGTIPAGTVGDALTSLVDVLPTLCSCRGTSPPSGLELDGTSLMPALRGEEATHRAWVYSYATTHELIRDERWLLKGAGRLYDCGASREGVGYEEVTEQVSEEARAARERLQALLDAIPGPEAVSADLRLEKRRGRGR